MAWLSVDKIGKESIHESKPTYDGFEWYCPVDFSIESQDGEVDMSIDLPNGTIEKLIGRTLTCKDEPVELL